MKRTSIFLILLTVCVLLVTACGTPTTYTKQFNYTVGETIEILDKETNSILGSVVVTDVLVIQDEPFTLQELSHYEDDKPVYQDVTYEAVIQINYSSYVADSSNSITSSNFSIVDAGGSAARINPRTSYKEAEAPDKCIIAAVKTKGAMVDIYFSFHLTQERIAKINGYYTDGSAPQGGVPLSIDTETANQKAIQELTGYVKILAGLLVVVIVIVILLSIAVLRFNKQRKKEKSVAVPTVYCTCGKPLAADAKFCSNCGMPRESKDS